MKVGELPSYRSNCSETVNNADCGNCEVSQTTLEPILITQEELFKTIESILEFNCKTIHRQSINQRAFASKKMKHPSHDVMKITDQITIQTLTQVENPNYLDINVMLYSAAIIVKEQLNNLNKNYIKNILKAKVPRLI